MGGEQCVNKGCSLPVAHPEPDLRGRCCGLTICRLLTIQVCSPSDAGTLKVLKAPRRLLEGAACTSEGAASDSAPATAMGAYPISSWVNLMTSRWAVGRGSALASASSAEGLTRRSCSRAMAGLTASQIGWAWQALLPEREPARAMGG